MSAGSNATTAFCSALEAEKWVALAGRHAYQSWHFDAISDDGREAVIVNFYDNNVLSPRFHMDRLDDENARCPAVSFNFAVDGRPLIVANSEYPAHNLRPLEVPGCSIGNNEFKLADAGYGRGMSVTVDLPAIGGRVVAEFEWLAVEADLLEDPSEADAVWNISITRADVSGRMTLMSRTGETKRVFHFRGTGFHDHVKSRDSHYKDLHSRMWGRSHFADATLVFERHGGVQDLAAPGKFVLIQNGELRAFDASCLASDHHRDRWGIKVPRRITYISEDGISVRVKPSSLIGSSVSDVKVLSEIELDLQDGKIRRSTGVTEFIDPSRLRKLIYRKIADLRIGRDDKAAWF